MAGLALFRINLLEGTMLPAQAINVSGPSAESICVANKLDRHQYRLELVKVEGMPCVAVTNTVSGITVHVPMSNVKSFEVLTDAHAELLTDPKRNARPVGLVSRLG